MIRSVHVSLFKNVFMWEMRSAHVLLPSKYSSI